MEFETEGYRKFIKVVSSFKQNWRGMALFKLNKIPYITYIGSSPSPPCLTLKHRPDSPPVLSRMPRVREF